MRLDLPVASRGSAFEWVEEAAEERIEGGERRLESSLNNWTIIGRFAVQPRFRKMAACLLHLVNYSIVLERNFICPIFCLCNFLLFTNDDTLLLFMQLDTERQVLSVQQKWKEMRKEKGELSLTDKYNSIVIEMDIIFIILFFALRMNLPNRNV